MISWSRINTVLFPTLEEKATFVASTGHSWTAERHDRHVHALARTASSGLVGQYRIKEARAGASFSGKRDHRERTNSSGLPRSLEIQAGSASLARPMVAAMASS